MKKFKLYLFTKNNHITKLIFAVVFISLQQFVFSQGLGTPEDPPSPPGVPESGTYPTIACGTFSANCNLFANGSFESGMGCASTIDGGLPSLTSGFDSIHAVSGTPDRYSSTCNSVGHGIPTTSSAEFNTSFGTWDGGVNNNHFIGLRGSSGFNEAVSGATAVSLIAGNTYTISFYAIPSHNNGLGTPDITVYLAPANVNYQIGVFDPVGLNFIQTFAINTPTETWGLYTSAPFTVSSTYTDFVLINNNTVNGSYVGIDDFTITSLVPPGSINAGADFQISCGQSVQINPIVTCCNVDNRTYELLLNGVSQGAPQASPQFFVNSSGNYTIKFFISIGGVQYLVDDDDFIVSINPIAPCFATNIIYNINTTLNTGIFTNLDIAVNADLTIAGTVIFDKCDLFFASGKKITILNGGDLKINLSGLESCSPCANMWEGIIVNNGGKLSIDASGIRDANAAVQTQAVPLNYTGLLIPQITIRNSVFNKNTTSVWLRSHPKKIIFNFIDNTITCRNIPGGLEHSNPSYTLWQNYYDDMKYHLFGIDNYYAHGQTLLGSRSNIGIRIDDQILGVQLGSINPNGSLNIIDYQNFGTQITNSTVSIYNNQYQFHLKINSINSTAIIAPSAGNLNTSTITIGSATPDDGGKNTFGGNYNAIDIDKQSNVYIQRNILGNYTTNTTMGNNGIFVKNTYRSVDINYNSMLNWKYAIQMSRNTATPTLNPTLFIVSNTIYTEGGICDYGIYIRDIANSITGTASKLIKNNMISPVKNGITISNIKNGLSCFNNFVTTYAPSAPETGYAIKFETCMGISANGNTLKTLDLGVPTNQNLYGLWVFQTPKSIFWCNNINHFGYSMVFDGNCISTIAAGIKNNQLGSSLAGLVLQNSAVLGTQGSATEAIQMTYTGTFTQGQTKAIFTTNNNSASRLYDFPANIPTNNQQFGGTFYSLGTGLNYASNQPYICPQSNGGLEDLVVTPEIAEEYAQELAVFINNTDNVVYDAALQYEIDKFVYNEVKDVALLSQVNDTLDMYGDSTITDPIGRFRKVDDKISSGQYSQAQTINMNTTPTNINEVNQKAFNTIFIASISNAEYLISNNDKVVLNNIALQCAYLGGNSVIQSRNFLMAICDSLIEFTDTCSIDSSFFLPKSLNHANDECQNFVQNGGFSEYVNCPMYCTQISPEAFDLIGTKWKAFGGTPDYYNLCTDNGSQIPYNAGGIQYPIGDSAYIGLLIYAAMDDTSYKYEIVGNNLCDQLEAGEDYCTKLFIASSEYSKYPTSSFGVYFAEEEFHYDSNFDVIIPQLSNPSDNFLSDTGWVPLQWIYHASGSEDVIGIGNFESFENTDTTTTQYDWIVNGETYVVLENVSIEKLIAVAGGGNTTINQGQSVQIGSDPTEVADYSWTNLQGDTVSSLQYPNVSPDSTTTYIVTKNQCNVLTTDTVTVFVSPTSLPEIGAIGYFNLYPNPAKDAVNIYFQSQQEVTFELHDIAGKLIYSQVFPQGKNGYVLPLNNFSNGIYICNLKTPSGQSEQRKLMVSR